MVVRLHAIIVLTARDPNVDFNTQLSKVQVQQTSTIKPFQYLQVTFTPIRRQTAQFPYFVRIFRIDDEGESQSSLAASNQGGGISSIEIR